MIDFEHSVLALRLILRIIIIIMIMFM